MDLQVLLSQFKTNDSKKANLTSITGGKWEIPEKSVKELYKLIRQTQKVGDIVPPLAEGIGNTFPLVLDIDIKYNDKHTDRQYTLSTVKNLLEFVWLHIRDVIVTEGVNSEVYVMTKKKPYPCSKG